jgi:hypothetical protein
MGEYGEDAVNHQRIFARIGQRAGLLWVGEKFYKHSHDWMAEAGKLGISRRIQTVPHGFVCGETWVFVAHNHVVPHPGFYVAAPVHGEGATVWNIVDRSRPESEQPAIVESLSTADGYEREHADLLAAKYNEEEAAALPGIFHAFLPKRIEYVCRGDETDDEIEMLERRGITPVRVQQAEAEWRGFEIAEDGNGE